MNDAPTPRTDALFATTPTPFLNIFMFAELARTLERELAAAVLKAESYRLDAKFDPLILKQKSDELAASQQECGRLLLVLDELPERLSRRLENLWSALAWNCEVLSVAQKAVTDEIKDALANK